MFMKKYNVAVVGALGAVGKQVTGLLEQRDFPIEKFIPLDIPANKGKEIVFKGETVKVEVAEAGAFKNVDIALFCAGGAASEQLASVAIEEGATVVDNSSAFRMDPSVPLVIPEVNPEALDSHKNLISNPNCSTIQMLVPLKPIHDKYKIKRIVVSTYQAVSGTGFVAIEALDQQVKEYASGKDITVSVYPHQIAFNALPHIDSFLDNGYTKEEMKMVNETKKVLDNSINVTATTVRIPVFRGHSESINIETEKPFELDDIVALLENTPGVKVVDNPNNNEYPMAIDAEGKDDIYVGRIRRDFTVENGLNLWVVADNLRKGAALNAVQIAETLVKRNLV
jgi:aspartate-semialdehyde dehydrogenase